MSSPNQLQKNTYQELMNNILMQEIKNMSSEEIKQNAEKYKKEMVFWNNEVKTQDDLIKTHKKLINPEINPYERFKSFMLMEHINNKYGKKGYFHKDQDEIQNIFQTVLNENESISRESLLSIITGTEFKMMSDFFNKDEYGKVFNLTKELINLIEKTDVKIEYEKSPYHQLLIGLEETIEIGNAEIYSIMVRDRPLMGRNGETLSNILEIITCILDKKDNEPCWVFGNIFQNEKEIKNNVMCKTLNKDTKPTWCTQETLDKVVSESKKIVLNFLNILNNPEVEVVEKSNRFIRQNKRRKGLLGKPDEISINLTGKLKKYVNEVSQDNEKKWELGHRFWVRGHWKHFRSNRYKNMQGKKRWVLPFIKGKGEMVSKNYLVGEKESQWENEKEMIKLIRSEFPDKKVQKHNRTALNGYEIDCYIPELKIGFEYNGKQHYEQVNVFHQTNQEFNQQLERDKIKREIADKKGIKLITIKYDEKLNSELIKSKLKEVENGSN